MIEFLAFIVALIIAFGALLLYWRYVRKLEQK